MSAKCKVFPEKRRKNERHLLHAMSASCYNNRCSKNNREVFYVCQAIPSGQILNTKRARLTLSAARFLRKSVAKSRSAVRDGGSDPTVNGKLRDVIAKAKANNMPNENIKRSIAKAAGELGNVNYEEIQYEGYAPGGVAVIVSTVTDNRNRTASDIRHIFDKNGGSLGTNGCVSYMFDSVGLIVIERKPGMDEDEVMMAALDAGASDVDVLDDSFEVTTTVSDFSEVRDNLEKAGYTFLSAELTMIPQTTNEITDPETVEKIQKMLEMLDDLDDVQDVYHNGDLPEEEDEDE